jgi:hypothetical protein
MAESPSRPPGPREEAWASWALTEPVRAWLGQAPGAPDLSVPIPAMGDLAGGTP